MMLSVDAMRAFLRRRDKIGGYLPLLAMLPDDGLAWTRLWHTVRTLDDSSEAGLSVDDLVSDLERGIVARYPQLATELRDLSRWTHVERELFSHRIGTLADYFKLLYYRAFAPVYVCGAVGLPGEAKTDLETFAMYVGYGAQIMDDTLDLIEDVDAGRIFVTREELDHLGLDVAALSTPAGRERVTRFRNKWALDYYLRAYRVTSRFAPANRDMARSWLGFGMRALLDRKIVPLPPEVLNDHRRYCHHFGWYLHLLDVPCPSEALRYRLLHPLVRRMVRAVALVDIDEVRAAFARDETELPAQFRIDTVHGRSVAAANADDDLPERRVQIVLAHYGVAGLVPTLADVARIGIAIATNGAET